MWLLIHAGIKVNPCYCPGFQFINRFSLMVGMWWKPWHFCCGETFLWYRSQIQAYTHEKNIVLCVKNIGTSGAKHPCYLDTTKTMSVCACLFSTTCSWLDLVPLHGDSSIINVYTMSSTWEYTPCGIRSRIHSTLISIPAQCGPLYMSTEWRNIVFELQNNWGFVLYPHHGATCRYSLPKMADGKTSRRESLHLIMLLCTDQCHI